MNTYPPMRELKRRLLELSHLSSISGLLGWDQEIHLPAKAVDHRAASTAELGAVIHTTSRLWGRLVKRATKNVA